MNILSYAPTNCSFSKIECCICKGTMDIHSLDHLITKNGYFVCNDCVDKAVEILRTAKKSNFD